jgi:hypothetical protein
MDNGWKPRTQVSHGQWLNKPRTQVSMDNGQRNHASNLLMTTELLTNHGSEPLIHRFEPQNDLNHEELHKWEEGRKKKSKS